MDFSLLCCGLLFLTQSIVLGQPIESPVTVGAAGEAAAAAGESVADAAGAATSAAADLAGSVTGDDVLGSAAGALTSGMAGSAAAALESGGALGTGLGAALGTGLGAAIGTGLGAGLTASTGALGLGTGALVAGAGALGAGAGALGTSGTALLGNMSPIFLMGTSGRFGKYGPGSKRSTLASLRQMLARNANHMVANFDDSTNDLANLGANIMLNNGRAFDTLMGNVGIESGLGEDLAGTSGRVMTRGRDGTIYFMQNGVDRLFGAPDSSVAVDASTPAAIVIG